ncbi:MAG: hypothetical protein CL840_02500 [Crocinitomicaceae bacterium]|nr:hypothetical protein [Crocinitomicaceae bacterium]|tara:strand:+ start:6097 stop:6780 length:684 start_codon:yes stop_codon:yes gene_type:complete
MTVALMKKEIKISVIGANGRTGIEIVSQALKMGMTVKALVRNKNTIPFRDINLQIIEGTPLKAEDIDEVLKGTVAVFVALNISRKSDFPWSKVITPTNLLEVSMDNIVSSMQKQNIKRVLTVSAWGVGNSYKELDFMFRFLINQTNVGTAYQAHEEQEEILRNSITDWTAIRPVGLGNGTIHQNIRVSINGNKKLRMGISRKEVAKFMLDIVDDEEYFKTCPSISND